MEIPIESNGLPFTLVLLFNVKQNCAILIRASDASRANTNYVDSRFVQYKGESDINLNFPLSGAVTNLSITIEGAAAEATDEYIELLDIKTHALVIRQIYLTPADAKYFEYVKYFVQNSGNLQPGNYQNADKSVTIEYFDEIIDENNRKIKTPARVDHDSGHVQVAKKYFDEFSVPMRMFILAHERVHYSYNTTSEMECDTNAVNITMAMGFPKLETLYAATKIFPDDVTSRQRSLNIKHLLDNYSKA